jgi:DNA replication protein DnaC
MGLSKIDPNVDFAYIMTPEGAVMRRQDEPPTSDVANARIEKAGVSKRYMNASFSGLKELPEAKTAVKVAKDWAEAPLTDRGFFFVGTPGVGKTYLAVAALRHKIENGLLNARFINVPLFLDAVRSSFKFSDDSVQSDFQFICDRASVVVLDDFGKERATDWATERLYVIVESRYSSMLPTIVTSNRTLDELNDLGYGATVSRLTEMCTVVKVGGSDLRPKLRS